MFAQKYKRSGTHFPCNWTQFLTCRSFIWIGGKKVRKIEVIYDPETYVDIIKEHATIVRLGENGCEDYDWKLKKNLSSSHLVKGILGYKRANDCTSKRKTQCVVEGETTYKIRLNQYRSIMKQYKLIGNMRPALIERRNATKLQKKENVDNLLNKHYGKNWQEIESLQLYRTILDGAANNDNEEDENICERRGEVQAFNI